MRLIEDLGRLQYGNNGHKMRYGIYECPVCLEHFKCSTTAVNTGHTTKCRTCSNKIKARIQADNAILKASNEFKMKAVVVHNDMYDYSSVDYVDSDTKVLIICSKHGGFLQVPYSHLNGNGCPECYNEIRGRQKAEKAASTFVSKALIIHMGKYDYTFVEYTNSRTKVKIVCDIHGAFMQRPNDHLSGKGCASCATTGFDKNKPGILYYLRVVNNGAVCYKIGITNLTVQKRFTTMDLENIVLVKQWEYAIGAEAYTAEQEIIKSYKDFKYIGAPMLSSGNSELFIHDILGLDESFICNP